MVGCGGIASGADAYAKIRAGATLVQLYSVMVYEGPPLIRRIKDELAALLARDGLRLVAEAVGRTCRRRCGRHPRRHQPIVTLSRVSP